MQMLFERCAFKSTHSAVSEVLDTTRNPARDSFSARCEKSARRRVAFEKRAFGADFIRGLNNAIGTHRTN